MSQIKSAEGIYFRQGKTVFEDFEKDKAYGRNRKFFDE